MRAHATQYHDGEDDRRLDKGERLRRDQTLPSGKEAAGETGERSTQGKGGELDDGRVEAQGAAGDFIFAQCFPGAADRHAQQAVDHEQCRQCQQQRHQVQEYHFAHRVVVDPEIFVERLHALGGGTVERQPEKRRLGNAADAVRPTGDIGEVTQEQPDDFTEAQGHDRQVVTAQAQYREAQQEAERGRRHACQRQTDPEAPTQVVRQQCVGVGTHGVEADITEVKQTGQAHHDVQAQAQQHVDQDQGGDINRTA